MTLLQRLLIFALYTKVGLALAFLYNAVLSTDECFTEPCLSDEYGVNFLHVSVATGVGGVVYGTIMTMVPVVSLFLLYTRCRAFVGGVLNGVNVLVLLAALMQTITWGELYLNLQDISSEDLQLYGSEYVLDYRLRNQTKLMTCTAAAYTAVNLCSTMLIYHTRADYCVDAFARTHRILHPYAPVSLSDPREDDIQ